MMLHCIIICCAFFALTWGVKESVLFDRPRIWLIGLHPLFYQLLGCYMCCGVWTGGMVWAIDRWGGVPGQALLTALAGGTISYLGALVVARLDR